jgi:glycosyltransferase involved in cell wall biosynthesis
MFSVIIPYYNKANYIIRCIDSVMNQSFGAFEIIVVDDGSTDHGIAMITNKYSKSISIISQKNQGVSAARNNGIKLAKHDYIALLDADDAWHPHYLENVNYVIRKENEVKIIGSHYSRTIDFFNKNVGTPNYFKLHDYFKHAIRNTYFTSSSSVIQKKFFEENDGFNSTLRKGEDHDVWFRVILSGGNCFYITNTLVYYSDEDTNQVTRNKVELEKDLVGIINTLYKEYKLLKTDKNFNKFISLYVYFNLYPYFFDGDSNAKAKAVLKQNEYATFFLKLLYAVPLSIGEKIMASKKGEKYIRLYLKFIIRYLSK